MNPLPFARVAILEPSLVWSHLSLHALDHTTQVKLKDWIAKARLHRADAGYVRLHTLSTSLAREVLRFMAPEISLLAPASLFEHGLKVLAYHHRAHEKELLPVGDYLQGISCHSLEALRDAENQGFDYAFLSPVFSTATHPHVQPLGVEGLRVACASVRLPVIALGGIHEETAASCLDAGAVGWAGIRAFL